MQLNIIFNSAPAAQPRLPLSGAVAVFLLGILLDVGALVGLAAPGAPATFRLIGQTIDPTGAAVPRASVLIFSQGQTPVRALSSDEQGTFEVELARGSYEVVARAPGLEAARVALNVPREESRPLVLVLQVGPVETTITVTPVRGEVLDAFDVPAQTNLVSERTLEHRPGVLLPQALREEVGIQVQQTSTSQGAVLVRGLTGQQVLHLIDGIRFNNATFRPGPNQYLAMVEPGFVERVEVGRGPHSAQYGSDSLGGTVNLIPARPSWTSDGFAFRGELSPFFRTADWAAGGAGRISFGTRQWNLLVGASGRRVQDLRPGRGIDSHAAVTRFLGLRSDFEGRHRLRDTAFTQWGGYLRFFWNLAPDSSLVFSYNRGEQRDNHRYDQLDGGNGNLLNSFHPQILDFFYARYEKQRLGLLDSLTAAFSFNGQRDDRRFQGGSGNPLAPIQQEFNHTRVFGYQIQATTHIGRRQTIVFGGEIYDEHITSRASRFDPRRLTTQTVRARFPNGSRYTTYGLFLQGGTEIIPSRLRAQAGVRYSGFHLRTFSQGNPLTVAGLPSVPDFSTFLNDLTFNFGLVLRVHEHLHLMGNISRGFRAPNVTDFSAVGLTSNGFEVTSVEGRTARGLVGTSADNLAVSSGQVVSELRPERLINYELGAKLRSRQIVATAGVFDFEISDFITKRALMLPPGAVGATLAGQAIIAQLASGAVVTAIDPRPVLVRANVGSVRITGLETSLAVQLTPAWFLSANASYQRGKDAQGGGPPDIEGGLPPTLGFVSVRWQPRTRPFWVESYVTLAGAQERLSSLEVEDQRIGALRTRAAIASFFANGAAARGLVAGGRLLATGETLAQVQERVLGPGVNSAPLFRRTAGYATVNFRGGYRLGERADLIFILENFLDKNYRAHGSGIDGPGVNLQVGYRLRF